MSGIVNPLKKIKFMTRDEAGKIRQYLKEDNDVRIRMQTAEGDARARAEVETKLANLRIEFRTTFDRQKFDYVNSYTSNHVVEYGQNYIPCSTCAIRKEVIARFLAELKEHRLPVTIVLQTDEGFRVHLSLIKEPKKK